MKRNLFVFLLLFPSLSLCAMTVKVEGVWPNQVALSWTEVKGAAFYDLYADGKPFARLKATEDEGRVGSNENPLPSNTNVNVIVAARDRDNADLDAASLSVKTSSWSGEYLWVNPTRKDNRGKCRSIRYEVEDTGGELVIKSDLPDLGLRQLTPHPVDDDWVDYNAPDAETYRVNAKIFNTTNFTPSKFMIVDVDRDAFGVTNVVKTRAVGMTFTTKTFYRFIVNDDGRRAVRFFTKGSGLASTGIFSNPEKNSGGVFTLVEQK